MIKCKNKINETHRGAERLFTLWKCPLILMSKLQLLLLRLRGTLLARRASASSTTATATAAARLGRGPIVQPFNKNNAL